MQSQFKWMGAGGTDLSIQRSVKNSIKHLYLDVFVAMFEHQLSRTEEMRVSFLPLLFNNRE